MSVLDKISKSLSHDVQSGPWRNFVRDNPGIGPAVVDYVTRGGPRPPDSSLVGLSGDENHYALARVYEEDARRLAGGPPAPTPGLPFLEASLRSGYETLKGSSFGSYRDANGAPNPVNGGEDCLIDLEGIVRSASVFVWTKVGQRIHIKTGRWKDIKNGLIVRSVDGIGAEHVSQTDMRGANLIDAFVVSGNPGSQTRYTLQKIRTDVPSSNVNDGGEHADCVQVQGDLKRLEIGMSTFNQLGVGGGSGHPGKGVMLNTISKLAFEVDLDHVNFRAAPGLETGAAIYKDYTEISMRTHEVYYDGPFWGTSRAFFPTATFSGDTASWAASANWQGVVKRGLPSGGDFCP